MALVKVSGVAAFTAVIVHVTLYTVPTNQNANVRYFSIETQTAIAAGSQVTLEEATSGFVNVHTMAAINSLVSMVTTPCEEEASSANLIILRLSTAAVLNVNYSLVIELI